MRYHAVKLKRQPALLLLFIPVLVLSLLPLLRRGRAAAAMTGAVRVPVLMYHSVLDDGSRAGDYTVTTEVFREDMLWLREHGYTAVFVSELVDFADNGKPLPQNPVVVTLDDGYLNNLTCVLPVLEELDMKAVISVIGRYSAEFSETHDRSPSYAHLTWEDICVLAQSGHVEIANHSYDMHELSPRRGCMKKRGESTEEYSALLKDDLSLLQKLLLENCGVTPLTFAYPYGRISEEALPVIKALGFRAALTCDNRVNRLTGDPEELYSLGRFNRPSGIATEKLMERITE